MQYLDFEQRDKHMQLSQLEASNEKLSKENLVLKVPMDPLKNSVSEQQLRIDALEVENKNLTDKIDKLEGRLRNVAYEPYGPPYQQY